MLEMPPPPPPALHSVKVAVSMVKLVEDTFVAEMAPPDDCNGSESTVVQLVKVEEKMEVTPGRIVS